MNDHGCITYNNGGLGKKDMACGPHMTLLDGIWVRGINGRPGGKSAIRIISVMLLQASRQVHLIVPQW
jgi:hypothetical protein